MKKHSPLIKSSLFLLGIAIPCILAYKYIEHKFTSSNSLPKEEEKMTIDKSRITAFYVEGDDGEYQASSDRTFPTYGYVLDEEKTTCQNGEKVWQDPTTKMISGSFEKSGSCKFYFKKDYTPSNTTLGYLNLKIAKSHTVNFAKPAFSNETADGLYALQDDYGTSYYFRGAVENNYVKFGDYYWRIIRINGDGSLRMIYDGAQAYANGTSNASRLAWTSQVFNTNYNDAKYVGYMYSPAGTTASTSKEQAQTNTESSTIKTKLEEWYVNNIKNKGLDQYIADSIFCNDRSTPGSAATGNSSDTGKGYGSNVTAYGAYARLYHAGTSGFNPTPQFTCPQKNDAFTVEDIEKGNGALDEKVGLITADEIVAAGSGKYNTRNTSYYLYKGNWYWSLSPYYFGSGFSYVFGVSDSGDLGIGYVDGAGGVAPVINLKAEYVKTLRGEGTMSSPYTA